MLGPLSDAGQIAFGTAPLQAGALLDCACLLAAILYWRRRVPKVLSSIVLFLSGVCPASAQWQRMEMDPKGGLGNSVSNTPQSLQFYLTPSPDRDPSNSLCLGCKIANGRIVSLSDYGVKASKQLIGEECGRNIFQIELSFEVKKGSVADQMRHEWEEEYKKLGQKTSDQSVPPIEWKSVVMQFSKDEYKELYLIIDEGNYVRPLSEARLLTVGGIRILGTNDPVNGNGGQCAEGYWVLDAEGPWLLDFTAVHRDLEKLILPDAIVPQTGCWALSIQNGEVRSPVQLKNAECHACGYIGTAVVSFRIEGHSAVPLSSSFKQ
jgi:hypothetical protein